jgi:hypothetical protein
MRFAGFEISLCRVALRFRKRPRVVRENLTLSIALSLHVVQSEFGFMFRKLLWLECNAARSVIAEMLAPRRYNAAKTSAYFCAGK